MSTATPWKYAVNVGPTKALIVQEDGSTVFEIHNTARNSRFEDDVRLMCRAVTAHEMQFETAFAKSVLIDELIKALEATETEIRRLHDVHCPHHEGKIGAPRLAAADNARRVLKRANGDAS